MNLLHLNTDLSDPFSGGFVPAHAFVFAGHPFSFWNIGTILTVGSWPNVFSRVVKRIFIRMIVAFGVWQRCSISHNAMHVNIPFRVKEISSGTPNWNAAAFYFLVSTPNELRQELKVLGGDIGYFAL